MEKKEAFDNIYESKPYTSPKLNEKEKTIINIKVEGISSVSSQEEIDQVDHCNGMFDTLSKKIPDIEIKSRVNPDNQKWKPRSKSILITNTFIRNTQKSENPSKTLYSQKSIGREQRVPNLALQNLKPCFPAQSSSKKEAYSGMESSGSSQVRVNQYSVDQSTGTRVSKERLKLKTLQMRSTEFLQKCSNVIKIPSISRIKLNRQFSKELTDNKGITNPKLLHKMDNSIKVIREKTRKIKSINFVNKPDAQRRVSIQSFMGRRNLTTLPRNLTKNFKSNIYTKHEKEKSLEDDFSIGAKEEITEGDSLIASNISWPNILQTVITSILNKDDKIKPKQALDETNIGCLLNLGPECSNESVSLFDDLSLEDLTLRWAQYQIQQARVSLCKKIQDLKYHYTNNSNPFEKASIDENIKNVTKLADFCKAQEMYSFRDLENLPELVLCIFYQVGLKKLTKVLSKTAPVKCHCSHICPHKMDQFSPICIDDILNIDSMREKSLLFQKISYPDLRKTSKSLCFDSESIDIERFCVILKSVCIRKSTSVPTSKHLFMKLLFLLLSPEYCKLPKMSTSRLRKNNGERSLKSYILSWFSKNL
ncbi:unnamed protein product [Moneuplotes crassus]|uniref:Uncharacterized protein n=1 Tax=Euplotes crassus TaxID=5936 RepID=A0AAD2D781_EUPCR|nr:unnamed protein product [Moneuplotes crassus]